MASAKPTGVAKNAGRSTRAWKILRKSFYEECKAADRPCWLCTHPIDYGLVDTTDDRIFEPDHVYPVSLYPERAEDRENLRASHRGCNRRRGNDKTPLSIGILSRDWFKKNSKSE